MITNKKKLRKNIMASQFLLKLQSGIKFRLNRLLHEKVIFKFASKEDIFTSIWRNNYWGSNESLSGPGSTLVETAQLRKQMPIMFHDFGIKSVFDAPCGDMNWMQHVLKEAEFTYVGGDIVGDIISGHKINFSNDKVDFVKFDITSDTFPVADVWLSRAVLYHLSNRDIYLALEQFSASGVKYILTTNHITDEQHLNIDIATGNWRLLNLTLPPFNFPKESLWEIDDYVAPNPPATLTLWSKKQIEGVLLELRKTFHK